MRRERRGSEKVREVGEEVGEVEEVGKVGEEVEAY